MLTIIFIVAVTFFVIAYFTYGRFLERRLGVDDARPTPSHTHYDGVDWTPARPAILFGHHFSSIAGAGPIVGPIIASLAFGWLPALLWVLIGAVFIGGVQEISQSCLPQSGTADARWRRLPVVQCRRWHSDCCSCLSGWRFCSLLKLAGC